MRSWVLALLLLVLGAFMVGCGSSDATSTKKDEENFRDRKATDIHGPPAGFGPGARGPSGPGGPPPEAMGPPKGVK